MSFLANLISKTKQKTQNDFGKNKWRRKADVEREREEKEKKVNDEEELEKSKKRKRETAPGHSHSHSHDQPGAKRAKTTCKDCLESMSPRRKALKLRMSLSTEECFRRLRKLRQPIRFFGETHEDRVKRLRQLEIMEAERAAGASEGRTNEFQDIIGKEVDAEIEAALAKSMGNQGDGTHDLLAEYQVKQEAKQKKYDKPRGKGEFDKMEDYILFFWKRILREWEKRLHNRTEGEKIGKDGKDESKRQKQARRDIKPFFKLLKQRQAPRDVVKLVTLIIDALSNRNYELAQEKYLEMSIGNAPWPMGVTQVGIHERAGRSKIFSSQIAHVLNDESQRKYIQAMKRLMTVAQKMYPAFTAEELEERKLQKAAEKVRKQNQRNHDMVKDLKTKMS